MSGSDNTIIIWNLLDRRQESLLWGDSEKVFAVALTSDNKTLFLGLQITQ